jgi:Ca2+-binding EF-hand superfamily protein
MATTLQEEKWRRLFNAKDFNKKGYVSTGDFARWGEIATKNAGLEYTDELRGYWVAAGQTYYGATKSYDEWREHIMAFKTNHPKDYIDLSQSINTTLFKGFDTNGDGVVSLKEYKAFVSPLFPGLTDEDVKFAFDIIDENGDGVLSEDEIGLALAHYYWDEEDTKYKHFYGRFEGEGKK